MSVFRIARHELRQAWRAGTLAALGILVTLLLIGAGLAGRAQHARDQAQRARFQDLVKEQWNAQPDRHPHRVSHYGYLVFRPRAPLAFFDRGYEPYAGTALFLEAHRQNTANFSDAAQDSSTRRFGDLTMAMVLQMLVPLLIFAVAGVSVSREREADTLALLLSQAASWRSFLWGKLCGSLLLVACLVGPGVLLVGAWIGAEAVDQGTSDVMLRALLLTVSYALYLATCAGIAVLVSSWHSTSRGALVTLLGMWLVLWVVVPRVLPAVATMLYPLPSRASFEAEVERRVRTLGDSHNPDDPTFAKLKAQALADHAVTRIEDLPFNYNGLVMTESEKMTAAAYGEYMAGLVGIYQRQGTVVALAGFLSPYVAIRTVSGALAGVDLPHIIEFERQAEEYRYALIQHLNQLHTNEVALALDRYIGVDEHGAPTRQRIPQRFWQSTPAVAFTTPTVAWALARQPLGIAAVVCWLLLASIGIAARTRPAF